MKKEGIQTRNRKLSSKSKKKKGLGGGCLPMGGHLGMSDLMKPLDPSKAFSGGFPGSMGKNILIKAMQNKWQENKNQNEAQLQCCVPLISFKIHNKQNSLDL